MFDFFMPVVLLIIIFFLFLPLVSMVTSQKISSAQKKEIIEAGFSCLGLIYQMFSLQFSCLIIVFIIFDLEVFFLFSLGKMQIMGITMGWGILIFIIITLLMEIKWSKVVWVV